MTRYAIMFSEFDNRESHTYHTLRHGRGTYCGLSVREDEILDSRPKRKPLCKNCRDSRTRRWIECLSPEQLALNRKEDNDRQTFERRSLRTEMIEKSVMRVCLGPLHGGRGIYHKFKSYSVSNRRCEPCEGYIQKQGFR